MRNFLTTTLVLTNILALTGTLAASGVGETVSKDAARYGIQSLDASSELELMDQVQEKIIQIRPSQASSHHLFSFVYPDAEFSSNGRLRDSLGQQKILTSLIGLRFTLREVGSSTPLIHFEFNSVADTIRHSFLVSRTQGLSLDLCSGVDLEKGKKYEILLSLPARETTEQQFTRITLIFGRARSVSF